MAAELISLSVWLDHILSMSSQAVGGVLWWGSLGDGEVWGEREGRERGRGRNGSGERRVEGVERWAVPTVLTKAYTSVTPLKWQDWFT